LATAVLHASPQLPQLLRSVVVSAHSVGLLVGHAVSPALQSSVQPPAAHAALPAPLVGPAHILPHAPQLFASCCSSTHEAGAAAGQPVNPLLQANEHALFAQVGCALATAVMHPLPHPAQSLALVDVSTQVPLHKVGVWVGHPETQLPPAHVGSLAGHTLVQDPQASGVVTSVSHPSSGLPLQSAHPAAHAEPGKLHSPPAVHDVTPPTCGKFVQSCPQTPQL
jgi:hypothetical protein